MEQTKAWLESEGIDLMRADRREGSVIRREAVDRLTLDHCTLLWGGASWAIGREQSAGRSYQVLVPLADVRSAQVSVDSLLSEPPVYSVRLSIGQHLDWLEAWRSLNHGNPTYGITVASLPAQTAEDAARIANAVTHAANLCSVDLAANGSVF
jgi:hypothetical protein